MNRKGQLYILAALVIGVVVFWAVSKSNVFSEKEVHPGFEDLSRNYDEEARRLVNNLLGDPSVSIEEISLDLTRISDNFVYSYAKRQDPEFGVVFVLTRGNVAEVVNFLDTGIIFEDVKIAGAGEPCIVGEVSSISFGVDVTQSYAKCAELFNPFVLDELRGSFGLDPTTARISNIQSGDTIVVDIEDIMYEFKVGDNIQLSAIARRAEGGQVQVYRSR